MADLEQLSTNLSDEAGAPEETASLSVRQWLQTNLFSSWTNAILTLLGGFATLLMLRGVLNFVFSENREWDAVRTNLRALMTLSYP